MWVLCSRFRAVLESLLPVLLQEGADGKAALGLLWGP